MVIRGPGFYPMTLPSSRDPGVQLNMAEIGQKWEGRLSQGMLGVRPAGSTHVLPHSSLELLLAARTQYMSSWESPERKGQIQILELTGFLCQPSQLSAWLQM